MNQNQSLSLLALGLLVAAFLSFGTTRSTATPAPADLIYRTGTVTGWHFEMDGSIFVRLTHPPEGRARNASTAQTQTWFRTPPVRSEERHVQQMVLSILTALEASPDFEAITIHAKVERALDGESMKDALPITAFSVTR